MRGFCEDILMKHWNILAQSDGQPLLRQLFDLRQPDGDFDEYANPSPSQLESPELLPDLVRAAARLTVAMEQGKKITVYGDFDVDGITSVVMLLDWLRSRQADCDWYIPERRAEGYGLHVAAVEELHRKGTQMIVTVDTGITNFEAVDRAIALAIDVIITDHHEVRERLPRAVAIVNPQREEYQGCAQLAGVGVVFQLLRYLENDDNAIMTRYGALAALGTVADIMPMSHHNRALIHLGLRALDAGNYSGLNALLSHSGISGRVSAATMGFTLAPRINAAGRMGNVGIAVELLLNPLSFSTTDNLAKELCALNHERQQVERQLFDRTLAEVDAQKNSPVLLLVGHDWHPGVIGIVASRLMDKTGKPVFMISLEEGIGKGSSRAKKDFHLVEALTANAHLLANYGGHELAAGFVIEERHIEAFHRGLCDFANQLPQLPQQEDLLIDLELAPRELTMPNALGLRQGEPYGKGNASPLFCVRDQRVSAIQALGGGKHTRFTLSHHAVPGMNFTAVWFGAGTAALPYVAGDGVDIAFALEINSFRGKNSLQLLVSDMRPDGCTRGLRSLHGGQSLDCDARLSLAVNREFIALIWRALLTFDGVPMNWAVWHQLTGVTSRERICVGLEILQQVKLITWHERNGEVVATMDKSVSARLENSAYWQLLQENH